MPPLRNEVFPLIFGASSAIGAALLPLFSNYTAVSRTAPADSRWWRGGLEVVPAPPTGTTHVLSLGPLDAFAAWLGRHTLPPSVRQIVALSSTSVETKIASDSESESAMARRLRDGEAQVQVLSAKIGVSFTLLRLTMLYGGEHHLVARLQRIARRFAIYPLLVGPGAMALRQPVHTADVATAVRLCIDQPLVCDRLLVLAGAEHVPLRELFRRSAFSVRPSALPIPTPTVMVAGAALRRLAQDQVFVCDALRQLGFSPRGFEPDRASASLDG